MPTPETEKQIDMMEENNTKQVRLHVSQEDRTLVDLCRYGLHVSPGRQNFGRIMRVLSSDRAVVG